MTITNSPDPDLTELSGSSNLTHMGYDEGTQTLTVRFANGGTYRYGPGFPADVHRELLAAHGDPKRSLGKAFHELVRKGGFRYERL